MKKKIKNAVLKGITWFFVILACLSVCLVDSEAWWIPGGLLVVSLCWLIPYGFYTGFLKKFETYNYYK